MSSWHWFLAKGLGFGAKVSGATGLLSSSQEASNDFMRFFKFNRFHLSIFINLGIAQRKRKVLFFRYLSREEINLSKLIGDAQHRRLAVKIIERIAHRQKQVKGKRDTARKPKQFNKA